MPLLCEQCAPRDHDHRPRHAVQFVRELTTRSHTLPKLTLYVDKDVIGAAKRLAEQRGVSVSAMFSDFIRELASRRGSRRRAAPITRRLRGLAKVSPDESDRELIEEAVAAKARR